MKKADNKIGIPWYRRNIKLSTQEDVETVLSSFGLPKLPKPRGVPRNPRPLPQEEPAPVRSPAKIPSMVPNGVPNLDPNLSPNPLDKLFPQDNPFNKEFPLPIPIPPLPKPKDKNSPVGSPLPQTVNIKERNGFEKVLDTVLAPALIFFFAKEASDKLVEVNLTSPIYTKMLQDPVLGFVLREAEKSNVDMQTAATYFANYDYENFNADSMMKELTTLFGVAAATRMIIFFVGRKVAFKM